MNAITTSIASADSISERNWLHNVGSPGAFVSNVVSSNGISGTPIWAGVPSGLRRSTACRTAAGLDRQRAAVRVHEFTETIEQRTRHPNPDPDAVARR